MSTEVCNRVRLEKYFLGEIQGEEKTAMRLHLETCTECRGRWSALEAERRDYLMQHPFREFAAAKLPSTSPGRKSFVPRWVPALAGVAACLMILPILEKRLETSRGTTAVNDGLEANRTKGEPILEFYCKRDGEVKPGQVSEAYRAGDELQFVYAADGYGYVTLASIDAAGLVSLYRPEGETVEVSLKAKPGNRQSLPFGVTLDDSPGSELFVLIYSSRPLSGEAVDTWLKGAFTRASSSLDALKGALGSPPLPDSKFKTLLLGKGRV